MEKSHLDATLHIRFRDLDTGNVSVESIAVAHDVDPRVQRMLAERVVAERCPEATPKSFSNGVGTFISPSQLIVVRYEPADAPPVPATSASRTAPEPLFSA